MIHRKTFGVVVLFLICVVGWFSITNNSKEKVVQSNQGRLKKTHNHTHQGCGCAYCKQVLTSPRLSALTRKQRHSDYTINVIEPATAQIEYKNEAVPMIRQRAVSVNSLMNFRKELAIGDKVRMEFFPDAIVEGTIVKTHQNITGTFGYVAEDESGKNLLFVTENEGRLLATVVGEHAAYRLLYSATTKSHHAVEIDLDAAPKGTCGCKGHDHEGHNVEALFNDPNSDEVNVSDTNLLSGLNQGGPITHIVDYMCVYSTNAKNYAETNLGGIFNVITQALLKANDAYEASGTKTQLRLVHTREFAYNDNTNGI